MDKLLTTRLKITLEDFKGGWRYMTFLCGNFHKIILIFNIPVYCLLMFWTYALTATRSHWWRICRDLWVYVFQVSSCFTMSLLSCIDDGQIDKVAPLIFY